VTNAQRRSLPVPPPGGQHRRCYNRVVTKDRVRAAVSQREKRRITGHNLVQSAVLVPLLCKDGELHVLLTERTLEVGSHKGQVCFPGGSVHQGDESLLATALREAWEETALKPGDVDVVGELDDSVVQSTGYAITPFVGFIPYPYPFRANASETKDIFFVPLRVLMDPSRFYHQERVIGGHYYYGPLCDFEGHVIWGATGRILKHLVDLLGGVVELPSR
jgi:8-oxo-dGTP pyrophosphatase MutT (NUDIX family)